MKAGFAAAAAILVAGTPSFAHRLDEYLEAAMFSIQKDCVQVQIRLTPGVAVFPIVLANIDTNADGVISETEQRAYAERVRGDMSLTIDGHRLRPRLVSVKFPAIDEVKEGRGEIQLEFEADLPRNGRRPGNASKRRLIFENHHQSQIAVYLVNCLVPRDPSIQLVAQSRNYSQSLYQLDYMQSGVSSEPPRFTEWAWLGVVAIGWSLRLAALWRKRVEA